MRVDFDYLCRITANLSGIPVRVYRAEERIAFHSLVTLPRDPMLLCRDQLWSIREHVGYCLTEHFYYYGVLRSGETALAPVWRIVTDAGAFLIDAATGEPV